MTETNTLATARQHLADAVNKTQTQLPQPLGGSLWIASSLLQKAIRRGREELALRAAATLFMHAPERLWRRCGGIAFEDIGLADIETLTMVTTALAGKTVRSKLGGEWAVASCIVSMMAGATKCRATDDLLMSAELHPAYQASRRELARMRTVDLQTIATGPGALQERSLALWYATGTNTRQSRHLLPRAGSPDAAFDALAQSGYRPDLVEIAREGHRKTRAALCPLLVLLSDQGAQISTEIMDDEMPPEVMIGDAPGWCFDIYSREGRDALQSFLLGRSETARWISEHVAPHRRLQLLGAIAFRIEGGLCRNRLRWPIADELRRLVDIECHVPGCPDAIEVLQLMRNDIALLNEVRAYVC